MQMAALLEANRTPCDEHPAAGQALRAGQLYDRGGSQLRRGEPLRAGSRRHLSYGGGLIDCNLPVIHRSIYLLPAHSDLERADMQHDFWRAFPVASCQGMQWTLRPHLFPYLSTCS